MDTFIFLQFVILLFKTSCSFAVPSYTYTCGSASYYSASSGVIKSHTGFDFGHSYGKNVRCLWTIEAPVGLKVELVADSFDVEQATDCSADYLELFDGNGTDASTSMGKFCGSSFAAISSGGNILTMLFVSDDSTQQSGFKIYYNFTRTVVHSCASNLYKCNNNKCVPQSYRCDGDDDCMDDSDEHNCPAYTCTTGNFPCQKDKKCIKTSWLCDGDNDCSDGADEKSYNCHGGVFNCGQLNFTTSSGVIASPGYPNTEYPNDLDCTWQIYAPSGTHSIDLTFKSNFNIESDVQCAYDFLQIYSDGNTFKHGPYCGTTAPSNFNIPASHVIVHFKSDNSDGYTGFQIEYTIHIF